MGLLAEVGHALVPLAPFHFQGLRGIDELERQGEFRSRDGRTERISADKRLLVVHRS